MFENPRRGRQARNFTTNVSKILDLKSSFEQIFFRKLSLGAPVSCGCSVFTSFRPNVCSRPHLPGGDPCSLAEVVYYKLAFSFLKEENDRAKYARARNILSSQV